jgi:hypothetical protein
MSLTQLVVDLIREDGPTTSNALHARLVKEGHNLTLDQVRTAVENAKYRKMLSIKRGGGGGTGGGSKPSVYSYVPEEERPPTPKAIRERRRHKPEPSIPISSPWNMTEGVGVPWPPKFDGGRVYCKLGPWTDD